MVFLYIYILFKSRQPANYSWPVPNNLHFLFKTDAKDTLPSLYMNYSKTTQFYNTREQSTHVGLMLFHKKCDNRLDIRADCIFFIFFPFPRRRLELGLYELSFYKLICFKTHFYVFLENKFQWMFISLKVQIC